MKRILHLLLLLAACGVIRADYVTITVTFTNPPVVGDTFVRNGTTVRYTNAPLNGSTWIVTNSAAASATNLYRHLGANVPSWYAKMTNATNVTISGNNAQFSIGSSTYAVLTTNSAPTTNFHALLIPWDTQPYATNRTNDANELLYGAKRYSSTGNRATFFSNEVYTAPIIRDASVSNSVLTNITRANVGAFRATNVILHNGFATNTALVNSPSANITNLTGYGGYLSNIIGHSFTITNLSSPGSAVGSQQFGENANASGLNSFAVGVGSVASSNYAAAFGYLAAATEEGALAVGEEAEATGYGGTALGGSSIASAYLSTAVGALSSASYSNSAAFGASAASTTTNQIRLGTSSEHISIPGEVRDVKLTNVWNTGTNRFDLAVAFTRTNITTLANGANLVDPGLKTYLKVSGPSAGYSLDKLQRGWDGRRILIQKNDAFTLTIANESGSGGGTDADRILTGTGGNITITNAPGFVELIYDSAASRWGVISKSN